MASSGKAQNGSGQANVVGQALRQAGLLAMLGGVLIALRAVVALVGYRVPLAFEAAPLFLSGALALLSLTMPAARGRSPVIALGMIGVITGFTSALGDALFGNSGPFTAISYVCAFAGAVLYGLSYRKPRHPVPQAAIWAGMSGAVLLILTGPFAGLGDRLTQLPLLVPAVMWFLFGRSCLFTEDLPRQAPASAAQRAPRPERNPKRR